MPSTPTRGADALVAELTALGIDAVFGIPGVHNLAVFDALRASAIRTVLVRHEQTCVYAADGYARATGRIAVALTTTGPGAANTAGAMGEALASRSPVLHIATQVDSRVLAGRTGRGALHESPRQRALMESVSVWAATVSRAEAIPSMVARAARAAAAGRGPAFLEIPHDFLSARVRAATQAPLRARAAMPDSGRIARAVATLSAARAPVIWAGGGSVDAAEELARVAEILDAPVVTSYAGKGALSSSHPLCVGFPPHEPAVTRLIARSDAILVVGSDLDAMNTQGWRLPLPRPRVSINLSAEDARRNYAADVVIDADACVVLGALAGALPARRRGTGARRVARARESADSALRVSSEFCAPYEFVRTIEQAVGTEVFVSADMAVAGYWVAGYWRPAALRSLAYPVGWGTLGFGLPAAIGAAVAGRRALVVCGDAGLLFAVGDLATLAQESLPVAVLVVEDGGYGMLRFDARDRFGDTSMTDLRAPDFVAAARAFGVPARRATETDLARTLAWALSRRGPALVALSGAFPPPPTTSPRWPLRARAEARP